MTCARAIDSNGRGYTMGSSNNDDEPLRGDLIRAEDNRVPVIRTIFSRLSRFPFKNLWQRQKLASMREVFKEEKELFKEVDEHQRAFNRLKNIRHILEEDTATLKANAAAAKNRLAEEERKEAARKTDDRIFARNKKYEEAESRMRNEYELKIQEAEYKKRLHPLEREVEGLQNPPPPPRPRGRGRSEKQKRREEAYRRYDREIQRIETLSVTDQRKTTLKRAATSDLEKELEQIEGMP